MPDRSQVVNDDEPLTNHQITFEIAQFGHSVVFRWNKPRPTRRDAQQMRDLLRREVGRLTDILDSGVEIEWLATSQKLITNVRGWLSRGQTETAMSKIDDYWNQWRAWCDGKR